ncbi:hypothetical protein IV102_00615 [bacterium]|nr:hypothetical protein [bacterium]
MKISGNNILSDYQALRQAASAGQSQAEISLNGMPVDLVSSQIDNDPTTPDNIVVSAWDGSFSSQAAQLTFAERQQDGKQVLEFSAEQATSLVDSEKDSSKALIDMAPGYVELTSWDGCMSSGQAKETYREYQQDGKNMLEYTKFTPGSPFMVGSQDQTITRNLSL